MSISRPRHSKGHSRHRISTHNHHPDKYYDTSSFLERHRNTSSHRNIHPPSTSYSPSRYRPHHRSRHRRHTHSSSKAHRHSYPRHSRSRSRSRHIRPPSYPSHSSSHSSSHSPSPSNSPSPSHSPSPSLSISQSSEDIPIAPAVLHIKSEIIDTNKMCVDKTEPMSVMHNDNTTDNKKKSTVTRKGKAWKEWEEKFLISERNKITDNNKEMEESDWKDIASKLECETRKRTKCMELKGRTWRAVKLRCVQIELKELKHFSIANINDTITTETKNKVIKNEVIKNEVIKKQVIKKEVVRNEVIRNEVIKNEDTVHDNSDNEQKDDVEQMRDICKLLGLSHGIHTKVNIYGYETHLDIYKDILNLVKINDDNMRDNRINVFTSSKLRDIKSKTKSEGKTGRTKEMKEGVCKKMRELKVNYGRNISKGTGTKKIKSEHKVLLICKNENKIKEIDEEETDSEDETIMRQNMRQNRTQNMRQNMRQNMNKIFKHEAENKRQKQEKLMNNNKVNNNVIYDNAKLLEWKLKNEFKQGLRLLCNMRIPENNENIENAKVYVDLLGKYMPLIQKFNAELKEHQNMNTRVRCKDVVRNRNHRGHIRKKF